MTRRAGVVVAVLAVVGVFVVLVALNTPRFANTRDEAQVAADRAQLQRQPADRAQLQRQPEAGAYAPDASAPPAAAPDLLRFPAPADLAAQVPADTARLLIRTGTMDIEVDSLEPAVEEVRRIAAAVGGYVADASTVTTESRRSATLELKVPAARFDATVQRLRAVGRIEQLNVAVQDVGEEYVDVAARMANAQRLEARLLGLLAARTGRLSDVLEVERELSRVREQVERYAGRLQFLRANAAVSTLAIRAYEPGTVVGSQPGFGVIGDAFGKAWENFVYLVAFLIQAMGVVVPLGLLAWAAWLGWKRFGAGRG